MHHISLKTQSDDEMTLAARHDRSRCRQLMLSVLINSCKLAHVESKMISRQR